MCIPVKITKVFAHKMRLVMVNTKRQRGGLIELKSRKKQWLHKSLVVPNEIDVPIPIVTSIKS